MLESIKVYGDDGEEIELYIIEQTQVGGNTYLLASEDVHTAKQMAGREDDSAETDTDTDTEGELWIFKQVNTSEEEVYYETIEDESELKAVAGVFAAMSEDYDIEL